MKIDVSIELDLEEFIEKCNELGDELTVDGIDIFDVAQNMEVLFSNYFSNYRVTSVLIDREDEEK